jgi:hypothetical protein
MIDDATNQFSDGLGIGVLGFGFGAVIQALIQSMMGPYVPGFLIAVGFFMYGMYGDARLLEDRRHWLVLGAIVIEVLVEPWVLVAGVGLLIAGWIIQNHYSL